MWNTELSLPMLLTFIRLIGSPIILPFFLVYLLPYNIFWLNCSLAAFFVLFGLTDFFDGYLARRYHQVTSIGAMLDHVADKFLIYSTLVALIAAHKLYFFWAILWIGREFFIMALRHIALENNFSITVSSFGKLKTVTQIACLAVIITNPYHTAGLSAIYWNGTELLLLLFGTALSLGSAYNYFSLFIIKFRNKQL
ncbi:MAG TPA: CDP-alcohol phosphatidyltransferase family protein [Candidatus Babeliales bacterium]|jgi:CDP-diacylglycerol--glycerol-3-phosphate 3-phosphatidyltransferase|nr:CDP-alcohol phosphatidyltransferase family protein [Candidatus Babeliales bacterium]